MGGFFAVASKESCVMDLFFGTDYHSHLGTRRGGLVVYGERGFDRAIHNIQNSPFRTKFEKDVEELKGNMGIGCISDFEPQPLLVNSHLGSFAITTVGRIANVEELVQECFENGKTHFLEMSGGSMNPTEIAAAIIEIKPGMTCTEDEINAFCEDLPRYKRPKKIIFADVPRNPTGKIEKPKLREIYCGESVVAQQNEIK